MPAHRAGAPTKAAETDDVAGPSAAAAPPRNGTVVLSRATGHYRDALRRYAVLIDETQVGSIGRGQTLRFEVPSGTHRVRLTIAWCSSQPRTAVVAPGETVCFTCSPGGDASEGFAAVVGARADDYIALRQTPGPIVRATKTPPEWSERLLMGAAFGFFGGAVMLIGALIWHATGRAPEADNVLAYAGLAVNVASVIVLRLVRRWKAKRGTHT